jgi:hypothetical protein
MLGFRSYGHPPHAAVLRSRDADVLAPVEQVALPSGVDPRRVAGYLVERLRERRPLSQCPQVEQPKSLRLLQQPHDRTRRHRLGAVGKGPRDRGDRDSFAERPLGHTAMNDGSGRPNPTRRRHVDRQP